MDIKLLAACDSKKEAEYLQYLFSGAVLSIENCSIIIYEDHILAVEYDPQDVGSARCASRLSRLFTERFDRRYHAICEHDALILEKHALLGEACRTAQSHSNATRHDVRIIGENGWYICTVHPDPRNQHA